MTTHILFLGITDERLLATLHAEGLEVEFEGAMLEEIWSTQQRGKDTGFRLSGCMEELIRAAKTGQYDYVVLHFHRVFTPKLLGRIGKKALYDLAESMVVEFPGAVTEEAQDELIAHGLKHFTSRTLVAHQTARFILDQERRCEVPQPLSWQEN